MIWYRINLGSEFRYSCQGITLNWRMDTQCCLCTDMLLCSLASRPVNFWLFFASHSIRHVCMFVLEQCYGHNHQWYKPLLPQGYYEVWRTSVRRPTICCYGTYWVSHQKFNNNTLFKEFFGLCWSHVNLLDLLYFQDILAE